jgi:disulfide bond formation protein DsbB
MNFKSAMAPWCFLIFIVCIVLGLVLYVRFSLR